MRNDAIIAAKKERRARLEAELGAKQRSLPDKRYGVIYADPPWRFEPYSRITGMDRAAENHYPTSPLAGIKALDVKSIAARDCVLFLWATVPMLVQALDVLKNWGFEYKSHATWAKDRVGDGLLVPQPARTFAGRDARACPGARHGNAVVVGHPSNGPTPFTEA